MKRRTFLQLAGAGATLGLTGCANMESLGISGPKITSNKLPFKEIVLKGDKYKVNDGYILSEDGSKIFDAEGDVKQVFYINNTWYYLLHVPVKIFGK